MPEPQKPSWLTPQLAIQVVTIIVTFTIAWATLSNRLDSLSEKLTTIQSQLPSKDVLDLKISALDARIKTLEDQYQTQDAWIRNTRERLAEHGWRP